MKKKIETGILVLILCTASVLIVLSLKADSDVLSAKAVVGEGESRENISFIRDADEIMVFLPGYADLTQVRLDMPEGTEMFIGGAKVGETFDLSEIRLGERYELKYIVNRNVHEGRIVFLKSANVATMYIDTESGSMDYIHGQKKNTESGRMRLYSADGTEVFSGALKSIGGRGNTTWDAHEKKPYEIELENKYGLLEMGNAQKWILLANANDPSHIRNKIVFDFAREIGLQYTPEGDWVDLYLNGEYAGLYFLTEKNEVAQERIDIENEKSFLVSSEYRERMIEQNLPHIVTDANQVMRIRYPKGCSDAQLETIQKNIQSVENSILAQNGTDILTGETWLDLIDLESWVKKYLIEEVFGNLDACYLSQYYYMNANSNDSRLYAGPVWDYDQSMGTTWQTEKMNFLWGNRLEVHSDIRTPWFHELYKKEEFRSRMLELFENMFVPLAEKYAAERIDGYDKIISDAAVMNEVRWNTDSYRQEIEQIRFFLIRRVDFLKQYWVEEKPYHIVTARNEGDNSAYFAVEDGKCIQDLPVFENTELLKFTGWFYENGEPFDENKPVSEDMVIYAKWEGAPSFIVTYGNKLLPMCAVALAAFAILLMDIRRMRKGG